MQRVSLIKTITLGLVLFITVSSCWAAKKFSVSNRYDANLLPYELKEIQSGNWEVFTKPQLRPAQVFKLAIAGREEGAFIRAYNPSLNIDNPANFTFISYPSMKTVDDDPVWLIINDWCLYTDHLKNHQAIAGAGYRNDTAWVFRQIPQTNQWERKYLTSGRDATGDHRWEPEIYLLYLGDYDYDNRHEAFFYINSMRELVPRDLFCVEMESLRIEWSLPVASLLNRCDFYPAGDAIEPIVIFTSYNPQQGVADSNFSDYYGYLTIVNSHGRIIYNRITAENFYGAKIVAGDDNKSFFVTSEKPLDPTSFHDSTSNGNYYISKINSHGEVLDVLEVSEKPHEIWLAPYGTEETTTLFVHYFNSVIRVYSTDSLKLLAFSDTVALGKYLGSIKLAEAELEGHVFSDGIYSADLSLLAAFPFHAGDYQPLLIDEQGIVRTFIINARNRYQVVNLHKKSLWALLSVFTYHHQSYLLIILSILAAALIIANTYRRRAVERVQENEKSLNSIIENIQDVIFRTDKKGRLVKISPSVKIILGYTPSEVINHYAKEYFIYPGKFRDLIALMSKQGRVSDYEILVRHQDGRRVALSVSSYFHRNGIGNIFGIEGIARDITFRKRADEEIKSAKSQIEQIFRAAAPLCVIDKNYVIRNVNDTYMKLFKINREDEIGKKCFEQWPGQYCHTPQCPLKQILSGKEQYIYELENKLHDGTRIYTLVTAIPYRSADGEILGIVENYYDYTQRKIAEDALRTSEEKYRTLVEGAEEAIFTLDRDGRFLFLNKLSCRYLGGNPEQLVGKCVNDFFPEENAKHQMELLKRVFNSGQAELNESVFILHKRKYHFRTSLQPIRDAMNNVVAVLGIAMDITDIVTTHEELKSEREFVGSLLETANSLVVCLDNKACITVFNKECERVTGYKKEEVIGKSWPEIFLPPDHFYFQIEDFAQWVRQHPEDKYEGPLVTKTGEIRTILWSNSAIFSPDSDQIRAIAVGHDITERKKAEQALSESEDKFRHIAELAPEGIFETNEEGTITFANYKALAYFGYDKEDLKRGVKVLDMLVPEYHGQVAEKFDKLLKGEKLEPGEYRAVRKNGTVFPVSIHSSPIYYQGQITGIRGVVVDITERKRNEEMQMVLYRISNAVNVTKDINELFELIRKELSVIIDTSNFFIALYDRATDTIYNSYMVDERDNFTSFPAGKTMTSYVIKNERPLLANSETKRRLVEAGEIYTVGTPSKIWLGVPLKTGSEVIGAVVVQNYSDENAYTEKDLEILNFASEHIAIALERKKVQDALSESEKRYELATAVAKVGIWDWNLETGEYYIDPAVKTNLGYKDNEIANNYEAWTAHIHPDDRMAVARAVNDHIHGKMPEYYYEHRMICKDNSHIWVQARGRGICNSEGRMVRMIGTCTDISERKRNEEALRESEARFSEALKNSRDVLYRLNLQTMTYDYISQSVMAMLGYSPEEIIAMGASGMRMLVHVDDLKQIGNHRDNLIRASIDDADSDTTRYRLRCKKGDYRWLSDSHVVIRDSHGTARFIIGSVRDITEQKKAEEAVHAAEKEKYEQAKRTAGVFAHEIRNALFPANVAFDRIKNRVFDNNNDGKDLNYYVTIGEQAIMKAVEITRLITAYTKIDSEKMPERVNLSVVVNELVYNNRLRISEENVRIDISGESNVWINSNYRQLLLVFNNLLLNSLEAMTGVKKPVISINWRRKDNYLLLDFRDNGKGISKEHIQEVFKPFFSTKVETGGTGIGLAMVKRIIEMYDGEISLESIPDNGTVLKMKLKIYDE